MPIVDKGAYDASEKYAGLDSNHQDYYIRVYVIIENDWCQYTAKYIA